MRRYYLHQRKGIFYAELIDPETRRKLPARSTFQTCRDDAIHAVCDWLQNGLPTRTTKSPPRKVSEVFSLVRLLEALKSADLTSDDAKKITDILKARRLISSVSLTGTPGAELLSDFLIRFWTFDQSPYVREKLAHGQRIAVTHCKHSLGKVRKYWIPFFAGKRLSELTRDDLKRFSIELSSPERDLSPATRNRILVAGTTPLLWAFENGLIPSEVTRGIMRFSGQPEKRGVLSPEEAKTLFSMDWDDERLYLANLTSAVTGLRAGEVVALRVEDIAERCLAVRHSYLEGIGLKSPKNGEVRQVPIMPEVRDRLLSLAGSNPFQNGYVFWDLNRETNPMDSRRFALQLREQLVRMKVGSDAPPDQRNSAESYWSQRNIVFHSWRHFYASRMADTMDASKIMRATGHKTASVFAEYAGHILESDLLEIGRVSAETFSSIVPLSKASGQ